MAEQSGSQPERSGSERHRGASGPARSLAVLWRALEPPARGPKQGLDVDRLVATAIELADRDGLEALSMRRVAEALGVGTMSLYTYVSTKAELLELMIDAAIGETPLEVEGADWRARLEHIAAERWALLLRHPWMLDVTGVRAVLGPHVTERYEHDLRAIEDIGLTDVDMDGVLALIKGHVEGAARGAVEAARIERATGMTDSEWWEERAPVLGELVEPERFPLAIRVGTAAGTEHNAASSPEYVFKFGLARILDGIAALVDQRG